MAEEQGLLNWIGKDVILTTIGHLQARGGWPEALEWTRYGTLQDVNSEGVILLERLRITWQGPGYDPGEEAARAHEEHRLLPQFYPWHVIYTIREQQEEEKQDRERYYR